MREEDEIGDDGEAGKRKIGRYDHERTLTRGWHFTEYEQYVGERLTLNKAAALKQEKERLEGVREMIEEAQEDDDNRSEDLERWERDLIRHGGVKPQRREEEKRDPYAPPPGYRPALGTYLATLYVMAVWSDILTNSLDACSTQPNRYPNSCGNHKVFVRCFKQS